MNLCSPKPISAFKSLTARSLTLSTVAKNPSIVSINQVVRLLEAMVRLRKLTVIKPFNRRDIKKLVDYLKYDHYDLELFVPACNFLRYHERLTAKKLPTLDHKITLSLINTIEDSCSDSDEEHIGLAKKDYDAYEVPYEVEKALVGVKNALMAPYVNTGQATPKRRRVSAPSYLDLLIKRNVVSKGAIYQLTNERNSPALGLLCLIAKPVDIFAIDNVIMSAGSKFIKSFLCFGGDWIFVTQVDAFVRNDPEIDP